MTAQTSTETPTKRTRGPDKAPRKPRSAPPMPENNEALHAAMHDMHDAERHSEVHDDAFPEMWKPRGDIDAPPPLPNMDQRWVRIDMKGKADDQNRIGKHGEGWRPRTLSSIPTGERHKYPATTETNYGDGVIRKGDLILCHRPMSLSQQAKAHYKNKRDRQFETVVQKALSESSVPGSQSRGFGAPTVVEHTNETHTRRPIVAAG